MLLTTLTWKDYGVTAEAHVEPDGHFWAKIGEMEFAADSLDQLKGQIGTTLNTMRLEVPFFSVTGQRGVIRGHHASRRVMLVTWSNGTKDTFDTYTQVLPSSTDQATLDRIKEVTDEIDRLNKERSELRAESVAAQQLFNLAAGENLTDDYSYDRYAKTDN